MSRGGKVALGLGLSVVIAIGVAVTVSSGFHGLVIYVFFASIALAATFLAGFGGPWIEEWSRDRFKEPRGRRRG
jgi:hypothetical protein